MDEQRLLQTYGCIRRINAATHFPRFVWQRWVAIRAGAGVWGLGPEVSAKRVERCIHSLQEIWRTHCEIVRASTRIRWLPMLSVTQRDSQCGRTSLQDVIEIGVTFVLKSVKARSLKHLDFHALLITAMLRHRAFFNIKYPTV